MLKENPNKNSIDLSSFLCELYKIKVEIEMLIIRLEEVIDEQ